MYAEYYSAQFILYQHYKHQNIRGLFDQVTELFKVTPLLVHYLKDLKSEHIKCQGINQHFGDELNIPLWYQRALYCAFLLPCCMQCEVYYTGCCVCQEWTKYCQDYGKLIQLPKLFHKNYHKFCVEYLVTFLCVQCVNEHKQIVCIDIVCLSEDPIRS